MVLTRIIYHNILVSLLIQVGFGKRYTAADGGELEKC
jgi:hypothetical protein